MQNHYYYGLFQIMENFMATNISYNVHILLHLADDVKKFSSLDNFNCFKCKNHMQKIKNKLHKSGKSLEEFVEVCV